MFTFLRSRLRFAGRIGWIDGRRGYPTDEHFVALALHQPAPALPAPESAEPALAEDTWPAAAVHPLAAGPRR
jgi:hypothetical protein